MADTHPVLQQHTVVEDPGISFNPMVTPEVIVFPSGSCKRHGKFWCFQVDLKKPGAVILPRTEQNTNKNSTNRLVFGNLQTSNCLSSLGEITENGKLVMLFPSCQQRHMKKWGPSWKQKTWESSSFLCLRNCSPILTAALHCFAIFPCKPRGQISWDSVISVYLISALPNVLSPCQWSDEKKSGGF